MSAFFRQSFCLICLSASLTLFAGCASNGASEKTSGAVSSGTDPLAGSEVRAVAFHSDALDREMRLNVYLPKGYDSSVAYPVLYVIHGYGGNEKDWVDGVGIGRAADELIDQGKIHPLIIVSPEMDLSYGINSVSPFGNAPADPNAPSYGNYEDYMVQDVVGYIDDHYSTIADRKGRYIGGLSMGGFISLHDAFLHPELFSKVGGHSPALFTDDWSTTGGEMGLKAFLYPDDETRKSRDPILLAPTLDLSDLRIYLDCGDQDSYKFYDGTQKLYDELKAQGVDVEYHLKAGGGHDSKYWSSMINDYLLFYDGM